MKNALLVLVVSILSACGSSEMSVDSKEGSITIPDESRVTLTQLPDIEFAGEYETVARPEAVASGGFGDSGGVRGEEISFVSSPDAVASTSDAVASGEVAVADSMATSVPYPSPSPYPTRPAIQPGTLTAGDYDDHLNPHLYQTYASEYLQRRGQWVDVPGVDFNNRIQIEVTDKAGVPYADARVEITSMDSRSVLALQTAQNGVVSIYTELDALSDNFNLTVSATDGTSVQQSIDLAKAINAGKIRVTLATVQSDVSTDPIDLMFVVDTTGSMGDELNFLQTELTDIISAVTEQQSDIKIGLVFYRDYGDSYVVRAHEFSDELNGVQLNLNQEAARGGGDYPEAMDQALQTAMGSQWRDNSRKVMFLIADAPPHSDRMRATWNAAEEARLKNIHIVPVAASGVAEDAEYIMRSVAALTESRYLFLTDDSGYGSSHAEPEIDCYVVTSLRDAMIRALNSLATGTRVEPSDNDIVRQVGNYENGKCDGTTSPVVPDNVESTVLVGQQTLMNGAFTQKQITAIKSQSDLDQSLAVYGEASMAVDFSMGQVLLIDMGQKNSGGFSIGTPSFEEFSDHVMAGIVFNHPGRNCLVTDALTNPYMFVYVGNKKEIRISEVIKSTECAVGF